MRTRGFEVDAIDAFDDYRPSLDPILDLLQKRGVQTLDFGTAGRELSGLPPAGYDVVMCMGVIEHIPHTPRMLLAALVRMLRPGGILLIDTPNLAQLPNRQRLSRGEPVMTPIAIQFHSSIPFEGHHREFTTDEVVWMTQAVGLELAAVDLFNYSGYGQDTLTGRDAVNHWRMVANPSMREIVMVAARKPDEGAAVTTHDWRERFTDFETYWSERLPPGIAAESGESIVGNELLLVDLQEGIAERDRMLAALQEERRIAVETRDAQVSELWDRLGRLQRAFDMTPGERLKRLWRRTIGSAAPKPEN
jgi:SAM-dependent methyltransferase